MQSIAQQILKLKILQTTHALNVKGINKNVQKLYAETGVK